MKVLQVTDTHLVAAGKTIYGIDPRARLAACVADINARHADAEFCVLSGDLTDSGSPGAYGALKAVLGELVMPVHLIPGNHDRREALLDAFPGTPRDADGFVQYSLETPGGRFLFLDTIEPGVHSGRYCARRCAWLAGQLAAAEGRPVYIFMHHPPFEIGLPSMDRMALLSPEGLIRTLEPYPNVRHIFFGHVHRPVSGSWRGIPFSALRGTAHQVAFDLETLSPVPKSREPPAYAVILVEAERTVVHLHDFLDVSRIEDADSPPAPGAVPERPDPGAATR